MIKRTLYSKIKAHLTQKEITIVTGPRQAGKTTIMELIRDDLTKNDERTLYLNLDIEWDQQHFNSQGTLLKKLELEFGKDGGYVFIDEIQRKENAGLFLKGLYDLKTPYKFIVSGSGSLELKEKIHESLAGRKRLFELTPITFEEFFHHKTNYKYEGNLSTFFEIEEEKSLHLLFEYMNFGGYPRVILESELSEKTLIIDEIYRSVLEKDITYLLKVDKTDAFIALIKFISSQIGNLLNYTELSSTLNITYQTVKKYLWYSQKTFILDILTPYARNIRKEISKAPVVYFNDLGLRNYSIGLFGQSVSPKEMGFVFENLIYLLLKNHIKSGFETLHFWRTKDKAEVDFVVERGQELIPVEVKFKKLKKEEIQRSLRSFIDKYKPSKAYIVNLNYRGSLEMGETKLFFIPYYDLLSMEL